MEPTRSRPGSRERLFRGSLLLGPSEAIEAPREYDEATHGTDESGKDEREREGRFGSEPVVDPTTDDESTDDHRRELETDPGHLQTDRAFSETRIAGLLLLARSARLRRRIHRVITM